MSADSVQIESLTDEALRKLLDWDPDFAGLDARPMLLTAARNRFGNSVPTNQVPVVA